MKTPRLRPLATPLNVNLCPTFLREHDISVAVMLYVYPTLFWLCSRSRVTFNSLRCFHDSPGIALRWPTFPVLRALSKQELRHWCEYSGFFVTGGAGTIIFLVHYRLVFFVFFFWSCPIDPMVYRSKPTPYILNTRSYRAIGQLAVHLKVTIAINLLSLKWVQ